MTLSILKTKPKTDAAPNMVMGKDKRTDLSEMVLRILSGSYVLMIKSQAVHWNVSGPLFKSVHDLTEDQYNDLFAAIDDLAERIRALGLKAPMNFEAMQNGTDIRSFDDHSLTTGEMIKALAADHELMASELVAGVKAAGEIGDPATEDIFTERLRIHQKYAWMLRAMVDE
jgi:starvation-inducible DNA-binding protein